MTFNDSYQGAWSFKDEMGFFNSDFDGDDVVDFGECDLNLQYNYQNDNH